MEIEMKVCSGIFERESLDTDNKLPPPRPPQGSSEMWEMRPLLSSKKLYIVSEFFPKCVLHFKKLCVSIVYSIDFAFQIFCLSLFRDTRIYSVICLPT